MLKQIKHTLTEEQCGVAERLIRKEQRPKVVKRAIAIRLLHEQMKPEQVATLPHVTLTTIYNWFCTQYFLFTN